MNIKDKILYFLGLYLKPNKSNLYTFYCRRCGQEFNTYGIMGSSYYDTIEPVGEIRDSKCSCVKEFYGIF